MKAKHYLKDNALNASEFSRRIGWNKSQMSQWLSDKGNIPPDKLRALEKELKKYGYK